MRYLLLGCFTTLIACSSDSKTDGGSGTDSGGMGDSAMGMDSAAGDAGGGVDTGLADSGLNGCAMFDDRSGPQAMRTITWQFNPSPKCIEIAKGQTVTWQGDFGFHPLEAFGGTSASPIMATANGTSAMFTFPNSGFYGYHCAVHSGLEGVVHVQ